MDRRHFLEMGATAGVAVVAGEKILAQAMPATARPRPQQADPASVPVRTTQLHDNLYLLQGAGGNMVLETGADGCLLIDASFAPAVPRIREAIAAVAPAAAGGLLINTHWHSDHTGGNEGMHAAGFTIIAHRLTRERLSTPQPMRLFHYTVPASPPGALPAICIDQSLAIWRNGDSIEVAHFAPAHTDTDISIHFLKADVLHVGDIWFNGGYPFIDEGAHGTIGGMIRAGEQVMALASASTKIVPGHGPLGDRAGYEKYREMLIAIRDRVAAMKAAGLSEEETIARKPTAAFDEAVGEGFMSADMFAGIVYRTL
jgi:glyoxylase-like metal-dependent hydrolase (beta-lactamase superfamily II)